MVRWVDEDKVYLDLGEGREPVFIEEHALIVLLKEQVLMMSYGDKEICELVVICNDLFYWGCADCEPLPYYKVEEVYKAYKSDDKWAVDKWCCKQRNLQPQEPIVKDMKNDNSWTQELEALPKP